jgi:hypothetical protein
MIVTKKSLYEMPSIIRVLTNHRVSTSIEKEKEIDTYKVSFIVEKNGRSSRSSFKGKSGEVMAYMNGVIDMNKIE